jgi:glycosyltransferase involved in cell wall biosynthesis/SAM-dependent methyltransferase/Tfp pilus assembly protein PilF
MKLKILTFNWHEPYLCLLSRMIHEFLVVEPEIAPDHFRKWNQNMRPVPDNVRLISMKQAQEYLEQGEIDGIIAHNVKDLIAVRDYSLPKIMVFHNCLTTEIKLGKNKINREDYLQKIIPLLDGVTKVFISEIKKADWEMQGEIILPGLDVSEYGGYTGSEKKVLRVGNLLIERDLMMGYSFGEKVIKNHPLLTLGMNPGIPESRISDGFDDLLNQFQNNRVYINTTVDGFEDGYNLAMLEAMATGMPVVTSQNKTSPISNGINGFSSNDPDYLNRCIENFMQDPVLAKEMGEKARETIVEKFPINKFIQSWTKAVELSINDFLKRTGIDLHGDPTPFDEKSRKNILMDFVSYPATTAHYMERALRQNHNVMTCGAQINDEVKKCWNLEALNWKVTPQDIQRGNSTPLKQVLDQLPQGWKPDFYFWLETGLSEIPIDLQECDMPKVCYLIDTHLNYEKHVDIASNFDFVFLVQKAYVEKMKDAGIKNVFWLPLACDPVIHGMVEQEKKWDVGFVGTIPKTQNRRKTLLERIDTRFNLSCERKFMDEMAEHYSRSKIVFNNAINNDLNMRVFEALCSGSLLLTDSANGSGLEEMFENRKHLVIYEDENIENLIDHYLSNDEEREHIAEQGRQEVLNHHTYAHRADNLMRMLDREIGGHTKESSDIDKPENYYKNIRHDLIPLVPENANCILEVGCAEGMTGNELKKRPGVFVAGIENNETAAEMARKVLDDVITGDIECMDIPYSPTTFDCIIFADVLEHLVNPLAVLRKMSKILKKDGTVIMSIPNVQFYGVVHQLIEGNWTYQKEGILDETHLRFFTFKEIEKLVKEAGLSIQRIEETLDPQYEKFLNENHTALKLGRLSIDGLTPEEIRSFFVFQYKIVAGKAVVDTNNETQGENMVVEKLLTEALNHFDKAEYETAIGKYEEALEVDSKSPEALVGVGNCYMRLQNPQKAEVNFIKAKTHDAEFYKAWLGLGLLELYKENTKQAEIYLKKSAELNPQSDKTFCALGILKTNTNDLKDSEENFCRALDVNIDNLLALKSLIEVSYKTESFDRVYDYLKCFLEIHPANINMLFAKAGIQFKRGQIEDSLQTLDEVLLLDPNHQYALDFQNSVRTVSVE